MESDSIRQLKAIVEKHTVRYEAWPHYEMNDGKRVMVGFDLELHGTHDHGNTRSSLRCSANFTNQRKFPARTGH
jgi:hypothetical protein